MGRLPLSAWQAFARRGMGFSFNTSSSSSTSVTPAFDVPIADPIILSATPTGGSLNPISFATFNFNQAIEAFGTYLTGLGTANGELFVLFNDGASQSIPVVGSPSGGAKFFGFTDQGAKIVQVQLELRNVINGTRDIFSVDDVRFVLVPEPASLVLAVGLSLGALACRRRQMPSR